MTRIKSSALAAIAVIAIFGGIALSSALGLWKVTASKEPAKIKSGEFSGMPSPSDIRGSYTWDDVSKAFGVPVARLLEAFGSASGSDKVNSLEAVWAGKLPAGLEIGTDSVRLFVALYTGLPHAIEEGTVLPVAAIPILRVEGKAEAGRLDEAAAKAIDPAAMGAGAAAAKAAPAPAAAPAQAAPRAAPAPAVAPAAATTEEHAATVGAITGKTTFDELKKWGFDQDKVKAVLGGIGPSGQSIRDYCTAKELSFSEIKTKLQELAP